jgi:hypothetical protein
MKKMRLRSELIAASLTVAEMMMMSAYLLMKTIAALGAFLSQQAHRSGHIKIIPPPEIIPSFSCLRANVR